MKRAALGCIGFGCLVIPVVTFILILKFVSERAIKGPVRRPSGTALSIPPAGNARLLPKRISASSSREEWQWTVVGDRNWTVATARGTEFELSGAYRFNSRSTLGGTHIWVLDVSVSRPTGANSGQLRVDSSIHGSNGTTVTTKSVLDDGGTKPDGVFTVAQSRDTLAAIPGVVQLGSVAGKPLTLKLNP